MTFKKTTLAAALTGMLVLAPLAGCAGNQQGSSATQESFAAAASATEQSSAEQVAGGWTINEEFTAALAPEEKEVFEKASANYTGAQLTPVAVLATQVVAGTNYAFLCTSSTTTQEPTTTWCIAVVYQDLEGNAQITSVKDIELNGIATTNETTSGEQTAGGWTIAQHEGTVIPTTANTAFTSAMENYDGMMLRPLALLGTQVVSGTNYLILCEGAPVVQDPQDSLYVVTVYADLNGDAQISDVQQLDLLAYVS